MFLAKLCLFYKKLSKFCCFSCSLFLSFLSLDLLQLLSFCFVSLFDQLLLVALVSGAFSVFWGFDPLFLLTLIYLKNFLFCILYDLAESAERVSSQVVSNIFKKVRIRKNLNSKAISSKIISFCRLLIIRLFLRYMQYNVYENNNYKLIKKDMNQHDQQKRKKN